MIVDEAGEAATARKFPRLVLVTPEIRPTGLHLTSPDQDDLDVEFPSGDELLPTTVWKNPVAAAPAAAEASAWFSKLIQRPVTLVYLDDPTRRRVNPEHSRPEDRVTFADGYPLLLTTRDSLGALNDLIATGRNAHEGPVPMMRFRPNVVVEGAPAWAEDNWRVVRIGDVTFRNARGCARCVLTTVDPTTATKGREPLWTLAKHRNWDGGVWFGINLIPDGPGSISVGDDVEIIE
jgi:uncharacterized protein